MAGHQYKWAGVSGKSALRFDAECQVVRRLLPLNREGVAKEGTGFEFRLCCLDTPMRAAQVDKLDSADIKLLVCVANVVLMSDV